MKLLERITLVVYSYIILILSVITGLLIFGWIDSDLLEGIFTDLLAGGVVTNIILAISIIFILLSIKCIFFDEKTKEKTKEKKGILLKNDSGSLMISKDTIQNLVTSVAKDFESIKEIENRIELDAQNNVIVLVGLVVNEKAVIKELSVNLQNKIKETVKNMLDLEIKEINIRIKGVAQSKQQINKQVQE